MEVIFENDCAFIIHLYKGMASAFAESSVTEVSQLAYAKTHS
jgi:hypothetical protein